MTRVRLLGTDGEVITDLDSWFAHAPPEKGAAQWRDGYSAKEQARAWLRTGTPAVPSELWEALGEIRLGDVDELVGVPEHRTRLDDYGRARQHDMLACARRDETTRFVLGVEAKACEQFDGIVADRAAARPPSNKRARCNLLSRALFGRAVLDETSGEILDERLAAHGYQLWTAAVGTIIEAQQRGVDDAVLLVHQFVPRSVDEVRDDPRNWATALLSNAAAFDAFSATTRETGATSHETAFVAAGTRLHVLKAESEISG